MHSWTSFVAIIPQLSSGPVLTGAETEAYLERNPDTFRGKVVYCNCDDPFESNFFKYFAAKFNTLGLKKLICTTYDGSPIAGAQLTFGEYDEGNGKRQKPKSLAFEIEKVKRVNGDGTTGIEDVKLFLKQNPHTRTPLAGGGDFRSPECVELLKQADIVVTNPPFSLFREYVAQLVRHGKKFLILGSQNAITYKEIFPLIKENQLWLGVDNGGTKWFQVQDDYDIKTESRKKTVNGIKYFSSGSIMWFTNLDHGRRHQKLKLMSMADNRRYNKKLDGKPYVKYDNYNAIEVPFTDAIPGDHGGVMGVPITFLDKYNPEQFEIVGNGQTMANELGIKPVGQTFVDDYYAQGNKGQINAKWNNLVYHVGERVCVPYQRILIRHKR